MHKIVNTGALLILVLLFSCTKDDSSCPENIYAGRYDPTDKALSTCPYEENATVIFSDSLGNTLEFTVSEKRFNVIHWSIPGHCPTNYYQMIKFSHDGGRWEVLLENDTASVLLEIAVLTLLDYDTHKIFDQLVVSVGVFDAVFYQTLDLPVDQRLMRDPEFEKRRSNIGFEESITILGTTFKEVYHEKYFDHNFQFKTYYNYDQGVVSFRDNYGKRWVFEEMKIGD